MNQAMSIIEKAAISSVVTGAASIVTTGAKWKVPCSIFGLMRGQTCPLYVFAALSGAIASMVNDGIHYLVKNEIHVSQKARDDASLYLGAVVGALSYYGTIYALNPYLARDIGTWTLVATGMGAETASNFIYDLIKG